MPGWTDENVTASNHEWHAMLNEEIATVQYDIKQKPSESARLVAVRLVSFL